MDGHVLTRMCGAVVSLILASLSGCQGLTRNSSPSPQPYPTQSVEPAPHGVTITPWVYESR